MTALAPHLAAGLGRLLAQQGPGGLPWLQPVLALLCVAGATAWLTARWLIRRRSGCTGDCSRCVAHGAETRPGPCGRPPGGGIRPDGLRVLQGQEPGSPGLRVTANVPPRADV